MIFLPLYLSQVEFENWICQIHKQTMQTSFAICIKIESIVFKDFEYTTALNGKFTQNEN